MSAAEMTPSTQAMLECRGLTAGFGKKTVVHGVDLALHQGEILLVLGHNGAGKTTLVRSLFGLVRPRAGQVLHEGRDVTGRSAAETVRAGIAFVPQGHGIFRTLSVRRNLELGAFIRRGETENAATLETVLDLFPILRERAEQRAGTMSGGQQQMLAIGMALMHRPRIVILDEPSIGLAPKLVARVMDSIRDINQRFGTTILMVEQNVKHSLPLATRVAVLKTGRKIYDGAPGPLADSVELMKLF